MKQFTSISAALACSQAIKLNSQAEIVPGIIDPIVDWVNGAYDTIGSGFEDFGDIMVDDIGGFVVDDIGGFVVDDIPDLVVDDIGGFVVNDIGDFVVDDIPDFVVENADDGIL